MQGEQVASTDAWLYTNLSHVLTLILLKGDNLLVTSWFSGSSSPVTMC